MKVSKERMEEAKRLFDLAREEDYQEEDFVIGFECQEPTVDEPGFVRFWAPDFAFYNSDLDDLTGSFTEASKILIRTREVEMSNGFWYQPEITFMFYV